MAGHSQFKNIMHRKGRQDAMKSKLFSKLAREITVAAKLGTPDPAMNPRLRAAVIAARGENMPRDNIALEPGTALAHGIYAVFAEVDGIRHPAAAYLGTRPTFDNGAPLLEVFLLDFDGDLYGRQLSVAFVEHLRADRRFDTIEALKAQMLVDCDAARRVLAKAVHLASRCGAGAA